MMVFNAAAIAAILALGGATTIGRHPGNDTFTLGNGTFISETNFHQSRPFWAATTPTIEAEDTSHTRQAPGTILPWILLPLILLIALAIGHP